MFKFCSANVENFKFTRIVIKNIIRWIPWLPNNTKLDYWGQSGWSTGDRDLGNHLNIRFMDHPDIPGTLRTIIQHQYRIKGECLFTYKNEQKEIVIDDKTGQTAPISKIIFQVLEFVKTVKQSKAEHPELIKSIPGKISRTGSVKKPFVFNPDDDHEMEYTINGETYYHQINLPDDMVPLIDCHPVFDPDNDWNTSDSYPCTLTIQIGHRLHPKIDPKESSACKECKIGKIIIIEDPCGAFIIEQCSNCGDYKINWDTEPVGCND